MTILLKKMSKKYRCPENSCPYIQRQTELLTVQTCDYKQRQLLP